MSEKDESTGHKQKSQSSRIQKIKRATVIVSVIAGLIGALVKLSESIYTFGTIDQHNKQLQEDIDKAYDKTHEDLEKLYSRPE